MGERQQVRVRDRVGKEVRMSEGGSGFWRARLEHRGEERDDQGLQLCNAEKVGSKWRKDPACKNRLQASDTSAAAKEMVERLRAGGHG